MIVVAHDSGEALTRCLDSLDGRDAVVVNNGPRGLEIEAAEQRARVVQSENLGFGAGCNHGAREADADVLVFLNPDTVVEPGAAHLYTGAGIVAASNPSAEYHETSLKQRPFLRALGVVA